MTGAKLTRQQKDRAAGVLVGQAIGDALGVPYEFRAVLDDDETPAMIGGGLGPYKPGEYSDDTQMAVCIAEVSRRGGDLRQPAPLAAIVANFISWMANGASDVGNVTSSVLGRVKQPTYRDCRDTSRQVYRQQWSSFGNGALMRTAPVALFALTLDVRDDPRTATAEAARRVAELTHADPRAGDACVLWCEAIRVAVLEGRFDVDAGLDLIPDGRDPEGDPDQPRNPREWWAGVVAEAGRSDWREYRGHKNGSTSNSLRVAWSSIVSTEQQAAGDGTRHIASALEAAVRCGHDTDTTAAIAGCLLGARYGVSAMPSGWMRKVRGWAPARGCRETYGAADLARLGLLTALGGTAGQQDEEIWRRLGEESG